MYIGEFSIKNVTNYLCNAALLTRLGQVIEIERILSVLRRFGHIEVLHSRIANNMLD
jgi:hypothetical protein